MRRLIALLLVLLTCAGALGCSETALPPADYTVETETVFMQEDGNEISLMYPQIKGYPDADAQTRMNAEIARYAHAMYEKQDLIATEDGGYEYAVTAAEVTLQTEGFLSGYIFGAIYSQYSGKGAFFAYTLNCDIENGCLYTADELLSDYDYLAQRFLKGDFTQHFGYEEMDGMMSYADMLLQYKTEYGIYPDIYFTQEGVGLLVETVTLLGGYAGYTLPYPRAREALNTSNPLAAFVTGRINN